MPAHATHDPPFVTQAAPEAGGDVSRSRLRVGGRVQPPTAGRAGAAQQQPVPAAAPAGAGQGQGLQQDARGRSLQVPQRPLVTRRRRAATWPALSTHAVPALTPRAAAGSRERALAGLHERVLAGAREPRRMDGSDTGSFMAHELWQATTHSDEPWMYDAEPPGSCRGSQRGERGRAPQRELREQGALQRRAASARGERAGPAPSSAPNASEAGARARRSAVIAALEHSRRASSPGPTPHPDPASCSGSGPGSPQPGAHAGATPRGRESPGPHPAPGGGRWGMGTEAHAAAEAGAWATDLEAEVGRCSEGAPRGHPARRPGRAPGARLPGDEGAGLGGAAGHAGSPIEEAAIEWGPPTQVPSLHPAPRPGARAARAGGAPGPRDAAAAKGPDRASSPRRPAPALSLGVQPPQPAAPRRPAGVELRSGFSPRPQSAPGSGGGAELRDASVAIIREMGVECGGSNVQMAINPADGEVPCPPALRPAPARPRPESAAGPTCRWPSTRPMARCLAPPPCGPPLPPPS